MAIAKTLQRRQLAEMGSFGAAHNDGTDVLTGKWCKIVFPKTSVFTTLTNNITGDILTGVTFAAFTELKGDFTAITFASGAMIAYNLPS